MQRQVDRTGHPVKGQKVFELKYNGRNILKFASIFRFEGPIDPATSKPRMSYEDMIFNPGITEISERELAVLEKHPQFELCFTTHQTPNLSVLERRYLFEWARHKGPEDYVDISVEDMTTRDALEKVNSTLSLDGLISLRAVEMKRGTPRPSVLGRINELIEEIEAPAKKQAQRKAG